MNLSKSVMRINENVEAEKYRKRFLDKFHQIMTDSNTLKLIYPLRLTVPSNVSESSA